MKQVFVVQQETEKFRVAEISIRSGRCREVFTFEEALGYQEDHFDKHDDTDQQTDREVFNETFAKRCGVDIQHHDHEQEQHHNRADIHEYQCDGEKFSFQQQPDAGTGEKGQYQKHRRMHGVGRRDNAHCREHHDDRKQIKDYMLKSHWGGPVG